MGLSDAPLLFNFEHDSSENLTYIPMIVRFNLDRFGLRISLEQWQLLPLEDRKLLARFPADEDTAIEPNFDHALFEMLRTHADLEPSWFQPDEQPTWRATDIVPESLVQQSALAGLMAPELAQWQRLAPFQRYVLVKLSRKPKLNHDFLPAMREFGLTATH
ncbi:MULTISPECIES: nitrate reductase associated protein [Burkholderia]|uniref:NAD-dependent aldehyde dehydrogenase associated with FdhD n=1 Tax=Burkholderia aenigmatica TaxID=2015348 RepID=A0A228IVS1_9BURK|nr:MULTISPECIES: nitrate reductase associated protein [Burkholderia]KER66689.1 hypothetical protein HR51_37175 [Burkholderia cepacia]MBN3843661.1 nitrate reductase maturation protein NarM [Burkholderia sp. Ac-20349]MDN7517041.1 nitrate reductase associated protein [Burkholderia sp. AU45251]MDN7877832.1 nitrate reductase associated protein [Burkholderia aenigmatica]OXI46239.1 hypothetical protein CFB84_15610 [Burkholderia aenigmatica]